MENTNTQSIRMKELVTILNNASRAYYAQDREIMSDREYDALYDELVALEARTGIVLSDSPTVKVGYEAVDELPKERHASPMLSLGKTKDREELRTWLGDKTGILSWKLDGLTVVLTYRDGVLQKAVTRGNGEIGEVITPNAKVFRNIPLSIGYRGELVIRGEAVISYSDFETINASISDPGMQYKNPRNLCSGSVRALDSSVTAQRCVRFVAFSLVSAGDDETLEKLGTISSRFAFLQNQGFEVVEYKKVTSESIVTEVGNFEKAIADNRYPSDGLVLGYDDIAYGVSLGRTAKFPRHSIAFKWADETAETILREIEWSASRTGLINPVAIFDSVELEGTSVSRASVHNVSIVKELQLGIGDRILVYKANMIIPQIAENITRSDSLVIPNVCPVCGGEAVVRAQNEAESLFCINPECTAKQLKGFVQFVSRDAMNIDGLSEATIEKFIAEGFIHSFADLFRLERYRDQIVTLEGFGEKSYNNLVEAINTARKTNAARLLFALGIDGFGVAGAKLVSKYYSGNFETMITATREDLLSIDHVGEVMADSYLAYMNSPGNREMLSELLPELTLEAPEVKLSNGLDNLIFVVTGSLVHFENRNMLKEEIEKRGGKVTGSVTGKTTALINNDAASQSSKNKTAKSLGVPILTEDDFLREYMPDYAI